MNGEPPPLTPWQKRGWFLDRFRELIWTSLGIPALGFWISLFGLVYVAIFTTRPTTDLQLVVLGLAGVHAGRRVTEQWVAGKINGEPRPGGAQPGQTPPQGRA